MIESSRRRRTKQKKRMWRVKKKRKLKGMKRQDDKVKRERQRIDRVKLVLVNIRQNKITSQYQLIIRCYSQELSDYGKNTWYENMNEKIKGRERK